MMADAGRRGSPLEDEYIELTTPAPRCGVVAGLVAALDAGLADDVLETGTSPLAQGADMSNKGRFEKGRLLI